MSLIFPGFAHPTNSSHFAFSVVNGASSIYLDVRDSRTLVFFSSIPLSISYSIFFVWILNALNDASITLHIICSTNH